MGMSMRFTPSCGISMKSLDELTRLRRRHVRSTTVTMFIILLAGCANVIAVVQVANLSLEAEPEDTEMDSGAVVSSM